MATLTQAFALAPSAVEISSLTATVFSSRRTTSFDVPRKAGNSRRQPRLPVTCFAESGSGVRDVTSLPSLYSLLGLEQTVELHEIKKAYRQMARRYHPDVCPADKKEECSRLFLQVQDAYETLSDPTRRADYDFSLIQTLSANSRPWENFGKGGRGQRRSGVDSNKESWKSQWEEQLSNFRVRETDQTSWGARMRFKQEYA